MTTGKAEAVGKVTYRCFSCQELIQDDSELVFVNARYIGSAVPANFTPDTRTHHIRCVLPQSAQEG